MSLGNNLGTKARVLLRTPPEPSTPPVKEPPSEPEDPHAPVREPDPDPVRPANI